MMDRASVAIGSSVRASALRLQRFYETPSETSVCEDNIDWSLRKCLVGRDLSAFRYGLEIYTPAHKREHGYYVLPFLLAGTCRLGRREGGSQGRRPGRPPMAIEAAVSGLGVVLENEVLAADELRDGRLIAPFADQGSDVETTSYFLIRPRGVSRGSLTRAFEAWLMEAITAENLTVVTSGQTRGRCAGTLKIARFRQ